VNEVSRGASQHEDEREGFLHQEEVRRVEEQFERLPTLVNQRQEDVSGVGGEEIII